MTNQQYRAVGFFLAFYERNLTHIDNFQQFKKDYNLLDTYTLKKSKDSFQRFLSEFRVARNVKKDSGRQLLLLTLKWLEKGGKHDIDGFAQEIKSKGLSHNCLTVSLASKVLFLNDPWYILPYDSQVKNSLKTKLAGYSDFRIIVKKQATTRTYLECYDAILPFAIQVEKNFRFRQIEVIRKNRMLDLLLWSINGVPELDG